MKSFFKICIAFLTFLSLLVFSGIWRLHLSPLRLSTHFSKIQTLVQEQGIKFEEIYLFAPSFLSLPGVLISNGRFYNNTLSVTCEQVQLNWKLNTLFAEANMLDLDRVTLVKPRVSLKGTSQEDNLSVALPTNFPSITIKDGALLSLPNSFSIPPHTINATVYHQNGKHTLHLYVQSLQFNTALEGTVHLDQGTLQGNLKITNLTPKDWAYLSSIPLKPWLTFFNHPIPQAQADFSYQLFAPTSQEGLVSLTLQVPYELNKNVHHVPITLGLDLKNQEGQVALTLKTKTESFPWPALPQLWPSLLSPGPRHWCTNRIQGGHAKPIELTAHLSYHKDTKTLSLDSMGGTLGVEKATVTYMDHMPTVTDTVGNASFTNKEFVIKIPQGTTKNLKVRDSQVRFENLDTETPKGIVNLTIEGPLEEALWVADHPPLQFASKYNFKPEDLSGHSSSHLLLKFPTHITPTLDSMETSVSSKIQGFAMEKTIADQRTTLTNGALSLNIDQERLSLEGDIHIDGTPSSITWEENFLPNAKFSRRYNLKTPLSLEKLLSYTPKTVQDLLQKRQEFSFKGNTLVALDYMETDSKNSTLTLNLDMEDSQISLPIFRYGKLPKNPATLFVKMLFQQGSLKKIEGLKLSSNNLNLTGTADFLKDGTFSHIHFKNSTVNNSQFDLLLGKKKEQWSLRVSGRQIELTPIVDFYTKDSEDGKENTSFDLEADINCNQVLLKENVTLPSLKGSITFKKGDVHSYTLLCQDGDEKLLDLSYKPQGPPPHLRAQTSILGKLLKGLDFTNTIEAERVEITATKRKEDGLEDGPLIGSLNVRNIRMKEAPILAKVLSIASIENIINTLIGEGILFIAGNAEFEYKDKKMAIPHLELTSSSLGITSKGYINLKTDEIDAEGYVIPANILNQLIGNIPIIGKILSGGSKAHKGLISVSYKAKGPLKDPKISSNPLSVLAPNFVKGLFSNLTSQKDEETSLDNMPQE